MARYQLLLAPAAKLEFKAIYEYGLRQWGQTQSRNYLSTIKTQFWLLTQ
jgi:toxin ParE1/3/4